MKNNDIFKLIIILTGYVVISSCASHHAGASVDGKAREGDRPNVSSIAWSANDAIPDIIAVRLQPLIDKDEFKDGYSEFSCWEHVTSWPFREATFATDKEGIDAGRNWLTKHFGPIQSDATLDVKEIDGASTELIEHSIRIKFSQYYRGIETDLETEVLILGTTQYRVDCRLCSFAPIVGTEKIPITPSNALEIANRAFAGLGEYSDVKSSPDYPKLMFLNVSRGPGLPDHAGYVLELVWVIDPKMLFLVNAHSGTPYYTHD
ncbi:MAG: hypothetical protein HY286_17900 [Planctomycetes bacterium]|nr:hypothetical protein [Planctomycetota bacterium]